MLTPGQAAEDFEAATGYVPVMPPSGNLAASEATSYEPSRPGPPPPAGPIDTPPASSHTTTHSTAPTVDLSTAPTGEGIATPSRGVRPIGAGPLQPGEPFGKRYHIIRLLGAGGMGAVYQAWDEELGVAVAIKVIRPEVLADPEASEELERRFKRELLLARQVTHKNVVRIHDLGDIEGIKYITMPYIQGSDLASLLRRQGKLPVGRTLSIARQIASGLVAAHEVGIVHRDLKPENIMIEGDQALIMDFGIARAMSGLDGTVAGVVRGTIGYMAPEQARGELVDQRADVYAFGLILYDTLLGRGRHTQSGQTAVSELMARMQQAPRSAHELDPDVPLDVDRIIARCLEPNPANRYQTTAEVLADLMALDPDGHRLAGGATSTTATRPVIVAPPSPPPPAPAAAPWWQGPAVRSRIAAGVAVLVLAVAGVASVPTIREWLASPSSSTGAPVEEMALAILPFRNASGDATLDWLGPSLPDLLRTEIGQSRALRTISADRLQQLLTTLRISSDSTLDPATLRRLAELANAQSVMWGQYLTFGNEIRIDATIEDLKGQRSIPLKAQAPNQAGLVTALGGLAREVRESLTSAAANEETVAAGLKPSSQSLPALREYNEGLALRRQGKHSDALKKFEESTKQDPEFALAYARLAEAYRNLGYDAQAEQASRRASTLADALPPREKYFILAGHARILGDPQKAIESYENLLQTSPDDLETLFELARLYEDTGKLDEARAHYLRVLEDDPKDVNTLLATGRVEVRRRDPQAALDYLNQALTLAIQFDNSEARGNILNAMGIAYKRLNRNEEALRYYREALDIRRRLGQKGGVAASLSEIAQINATLGQPAAALENYNEALQLRREIGDTQGIGNTLLNLGSLHVDRGEYAQALKLFSESLQVQRDVGNKTYEALLLNNIGSVYYNQARYEDARTYFERALALREELKVPAEIAQTVHNLAEVNLRIGQYDRALELYLRALDLNRTSGDKRGAAIRSFSVGTLFEYQGRYGAALSSKEEALKTFEELGDNSPLMVEMLAGRGNALSQVGRFDEARKTLDAALARARTLENQVLAGQILNLLGDSHYYAGDAPAARRFFEQASQAATASADRHLTLLTQVNQAKLDARERPAAAVPALTRLVQQTDAEGLRYLSISAAIHLGEALGSLKRNPAARQELERAIARSERLGLRALMAKAHLALSRVLAAENRTQDAASHQADATRLLNEIYKEAGTDTIRKRVDLAADGR